MKRLLVLILLHAVLVARTCEQEQKENNHSHRAVNINTPLLGLPQPEPYTIPMPVEDPTIPPNLFAIVADYDGEARRPTFATDPCLSRSNVSCIVATVGAIVFVVSAASFYGPLGGGVDSQTIPHLYFGASAGLTTSGYLGAMTYGLDRCYEVNRARRARYLNSLSTMATNLRNKIGKGATIFGKVCVALGAPLLPMGIAWGSCQGLAVPKDPSEETQPSILAEIKASKYMFAAGSTLTTLGTASWLLGKKLSPRNN